MAGRSVLLEDAKQIEEAALQGAGALSEQVDSLLADGTAELSANLEEGLREWKEAAVEQDRVLTDFMAETKCVSNHIHTHTASPQFAIYSNYSGYKPHASSITLVLHF
jgi:hypothetical protein